MDVIIWFVNVNMNFVGFVMENIQDCIIDYGIYVDVLVILIKYNI